MMKRITTVIFFFIQVIYMLPVFADSMLSRTLQHDGNIRSYYLYLPKKSETVESPLIIALHGRGGDGKRIARQSELNQRADKHGFIVAYPNAIDGVWFYPRGVGGFGDEPNDTDFIHKVINSIQSKYSVNNRKIYVTGLSNGGFMAQRLACDLPDLFAAMASVAATAFSGMDQTCVTNVPMPVVFFHGTEDLAVPWHGRDVKNSDGSWQRATHSVSETLKFWSTYNGCRAQISNRTVESNGYSKDTFVKVFSTENCVNNSAVKLYQIVGGGHNWPGVEGEIPENIAGRVSQDIHASDELWSFFEKYINSPTTTSD